MHAASGTRQHQPRWDEAATALMRMPPSRTVGTTTRRTAQGAHILLACRLPSPFLEPAAPVIGSLQHHPRSAAVRLTWALRVASTPARAPTSTAWAHEDSGVSESGAGHRSVVRPGKHMRWPGRPARAAAPGAPDRSAWTARPRQDRATSTTRACRGTSTAGCRPAACGLCGGLRRLSAPHQPYQSLSTDGCRTGSLVQADPLPPVALELRNPHYLGENQMGDPREAHQAAWWPRSLRWDRLTTSKGDRRPDPIHLDVAGSLARQLADHHRWGPLLREGRSRPDCPTTLQTSTSTSTSKTSCRSIGVMEVTYCRWRQKHGGLKTMLS